MTATLQGVTARKKAVSSPEMDAAKETSSSSYLKYRIWTLQAAKNLDATCGLFNKTKAAWDAVSVPAQTADPTCTGSGTVTVTNPGSQTGTVGVAATLNMSASGGTPPYTWSATGLPAGLSISSSSGQISGTPTTAGTYIVTVTASGGGTGSTSFTWTVNPATTPGCSGSNANDVAIGDNTTVSSSIVISGCTGNASATSTVEVHSVHTYIGDLKFDLIAPDGMGSRHLCWHGGRHREEGPRLRRPCLANCAWGCGGGMARGEPL